MPFSYKCHDCYWYSARFGCGKRDDDAYCPADDVDDYLDQEAEYRELEYNWNPNSE